MLLRGVTSPCLQIYSLNWFWEAARKDACHFHSASQNSLRASSLKTTQRGHALCTKPVITVVLLRGSTHIGLITTNPSWWWNTKQVKCTTFKRVERLKQLILVEETWIRYADLLLSTCLTTDNKQNMMAPWCHLHVLSWLPDLCLSSVLGRDRC